MKEFETSSTDFVDKLHRINNPKFDKNIIEKRSHDLHYDLNVIFGADLYNYSQKKRTARA